MKIIIVEDEAVMALFLKQALQNMGHEVLAICNSAQACLEALHKEEADLILLDIMIKGSIDGLQLSQTIYQQYKSKMIFITSFKDSQSIQEAQLSKPLGYLIKPIDEHDLEAIMMVANTSIKNNSQITCKNVIHFSTYHYFIDENLLYNKENELISLSKKEHTCIKQLIKNLDRYVSHEQLLFEIWKGENYNKSSLRELIFRLRKKLPSITINSDQHLGYNLKS